MILIYNIDLRNKINNSFRLNIMNDKKHIYNSNLIKRYKSKIRKTYIYVIDQ